MSSGNFDGLVTRGLKIADALENLAQEFNAKSVHHAALDNEAHAIRAYCDELARGHPMPSKISSAVLGELICESSDARRVFSELERFYVELNRVP